MEYADWRAQYESDELAAQQAFQEMQRLTLALQDIADPVGGMIRKLRPDEKINGRTAIGLSENPEYYRSLAERALGEG